MGKGAACSVITNNAANYTLPASSDCVCSFKVGGGRVVDERNQKKKLSEIEKLKGARELITVRSLSLDGRHCYRHVFCVVFFLFRLRQTCSTVIIYDLGCRCVYISRNGTRPQRAADCLSLSLPPTFYFSTTAECYYLVDSCPMS